MEQINEYVNYLACRKECIICFQDRNLKEFCGEHKFCHNCCNEWAKKSILCPCCRKPCVNKKYLTYNYNLLNIDYDEFKRKYEYNFLLWHKEKCINSKHKFLITKFDTHLLFYCYDCHVEQIFMT